MAASVPIRKGSSVKLPTKTGQSFSAGLGWDSAQDAASKVDLDLWVLRNNSGTWEPISWVNQLWENPQAGRNSEGNPFIVSPEGDVIYMGDDRTGAEAATGYDENVKLDLSKTPAGVTSYALFVTNYDEKVPSDTLGMASNIVCGVTQDGSGNELKVELGEEFPFAVTVLLCTIDRQADGSWLMTAKKEEYTDSMLEVATKTGVDLAHWHPNN